MSKIFLNRHQVEAKTGMKRSTIYDHIRKGSFPLPAKISPRCVRWLESEIDEWMRIQLKNRYETKPFTEKDIDELISEIEE